LAVVRVVDAHHDLDDGQSHRQEEEGGLQRYPRLRRTNDLAILACNETAGGKWSSGNKWHE
jgi:hypothetical protein